MKSRAAEPDLRNIENASRLAPETICIMANSMLILGHIPEPLSKNRTVLIQKGKENLKTINQWRPITISSIFLRIINRVWARRLSGILTCDLQVSFKAQDGCLLNTMILNNIIKDHRDRLIPHNLISLNMQKAFDRASQHSIRQALERFGVLPLVKGYVMSIYEDSYTTVTWTVICGGTSTRQIKLNRGEQRRDTYSIWWWTSYWSHCPGSMVYSLVKNGYPSSPTPMTCFWWPGLGRTTKSY